MQKRDRPSPMGNVELLKTIAPDEFDGQSFMYVERNGGEACILQHADNAQGSDRVDVYEAIAKLESLLLRVFAAKDPVNYEFDIPDAESICECFDEPNGTWVVTTQPVKQFDTRAVIELHVGGNKPLKLFRLLIVFSDFYIEVVAAFLPDAGM